MMTTKIEKAVVTLSPTNFFATVYPLKGECDNPLRVIYGVARRKHWHRGIRVCYGDKRPCKDPIVEAILQAVETGKKSIAKQYGVFKLAVRPIRCHNGKPIGLPTWRDTKEMYLIDETWKKVFPLQEVTTGDFLCGEGKLSLHMVRVIHKKNLIELIKEGKLDFSLPKEFYKLKYLS